MARNGDLRKLLEKKLNVKQAQLYHIAKGIADSLSIPTSDAMLVLAAKNRINLHKYGGNLPAGKLDQIRGLLPYVAAAATQQPAQVAFSGNGKRAAARPKRISKVKLENAENDPILDRATLADIEAMVPMYRTLSQLENSMRQFIARILKAKHGMDWWDKAASRGLQETVAKRTADDQVNAWHQKRSSSPIDYLDLDQLKALVRTAQNDFVPAFFPSIEWFQVFVDEIYRSRCVVCHMNPLIQTNIDAVSVRFNQWERLVKAKVADVKELENRAPAATVTSVG